MNLNILIIVGQFYALNVSILWIKIRPSGQNVSIPPICVLLAFLLNLKFPLILIFH